MSDVTDLQAADAPNESTCSPVDAPSGIHMAKPLDEMSLASVSVVADAAAIIAQKKMEAAAAKMAAAQAAMDRLAAMKAGKPLPPKPEAPAAPTAPAIEAKVAEAPKAVEAPKANKVPEAPTPVAPPPAQVKAAPAKVEAKAAAPTPAVPVDEVKAAVPAPVVEAPKPVAKIISTDKPVQHESGIIRLAHSLRKKAADQAPELPKVTGKRSLDPIANHSGLGRPSTAKPRKIVTPGLIFLLALMTFYALYASGNLPQFDRWTDSVVNDAHAHNDQVVGGILHAGQYILIGGALLIVLVTVLLIKNYIHQKHNAEHERDFHTR